MRRTLVILVSACAAVGILLHVLTRDDDREPEDVGRSARRTESGSQEKPADPGGRRSATAVAPVRMRGDGDLSSPPEPDRALLRAFEAEPVDDSFAAEQTPIVRERIRKLLAGREPAEVDVPLIECRTRWCRIVVTGRNEQAFRVVVESMQDERGFLGLAELLTLEGFQRDAEGRLEVNVMLKF